MDNSITDNNNGGQLVNPIQVLVHARTSLPHMRKHLDRIAGDPTRKDQVAQMEKMFQGMGEATDKLQKEINRQAQNEQPQQPQLDPDFVHELIKTMGNLKIKDTKTKGDLAIKAQAQQHKDRLLDLKTASDIRRKNASSSVS